MKGRFGGVGCGEVRHLLPKAPVFRDDSVFWRVVDSEWGFVLMVSVTDEGLFCSGSCFGEVYVH